jgi:hypothetical protein
MHKITNSMVEQIVEILVHGGLKTEFVDLEKQLLT